MNEAETLRREVERYRRALGDVFLFSRLDLRSVLFGCEIGTRMSEQFRLDAAAACHRIETIALEALDRKNRAT